MKAPWARWVGAALVAVWVAVTAYNATRPLPPGTRLASTPQAVAAGDVTFLDDITGADAYGRGFNTHTIFDAMLHSIGEARNLLILDCHLCNDMHRTAPDAVTALTPMATQLMDALVARKAAVPGLQVLVMADPVNDLYGSAPGPQFARLRAAGVQVVTADLARLRDRNILYSGLWRLTFRWWGEPDAAHGWLPNPFSDDGPPLTARAWAQLANLKSSDRRLLIADDAHGELTALVGSAEPAMASSIHTVTALQVRGVVVEPLLASELALAHAFGWRGSLTPRETPPALAATAGGEALQLQWLGEGAIRTAVLSHIAAARSGDSIDIASDALSERSVIAALLAASRRGAMVRMILDPQKNASLWRSANQSVGSELLAASDGRIHVAWYRTHTEQFRAALVLIHGRRPTWLATGSASLTRRDLGDYDLALDAAVSGPPTAAPLASAQAFFDTLWNERGPPGIEYTADADTWTDPSQLRYWTYRVMELLGISRT
ncbi:MAG TPA: phospholipase D-like domain-containing protein [Steroidobacteraceae bacterium]|nr:phospholipase D-like domain-containing protein [Steroidobacteraceae bacterium]